MTESKICTCPSGDGSLRWPCPAHPAVDQADVAAKLTFINGRPAMCGCQVEYSDGGGEYSDVIYVTLCAKHSGSAILDLVATNRIALTPEYEGQWHADLYLDREIPLAKVEGATPAEAVLALMSAERIDPEQESVEQAGGDERAEFERAFTVQEGIYFDDKRGEYRSMNLCAIEASDAQDLNLQLQGWQARAALAQPSPAQVKQAEAERPEVFGLERYRVEKTGQGFWPYCVRAGDGTRELFAGHLKQCKRVAAQLATAFEDGKFVAGALRAENAKLSEALDRWPLIRDSLKLRLADALARVAALESKLAELEKQEPVAWGAFHFGGKRDGKLYTHCETEAQIEAYILDMHRSSDSLTLSKGPLYAAPVDQAQHSVPDGAADLCRFLAKLYCELDGLRYSTAKLPAEQIADALIFKWPVLQGARNQLNIKRISEQPYDESKLHSAIAAMLAAAPGNSAQHSVPEGLALIPVRETEAMHDAVMALLYKGVARTDTQKLLDAYIAAAPGKEGV